MVLQIIFILAGIAILSRGELRASKNRVVPAWAGRVVGAVIVVAAVISWVLPNEPSWIPLAVCLLPAFVAIVFGLAVARRDEEQPLV